MEQARALLDLWLKMGQAAGDSDVPLFRSIQQQFTQLYRRCDNATQGLYHALVSDSNKQWARAHPDHFKQWQRENGFV